MKRAWFATIIMLMVGISMVAQAGEHIFPRLVYRSLLPLPVGAVLIYGKIVIEDENRLYQRVKPLKALEDFFRHKAKQMPILVTSGGLTASSHTDDNGNFVAAFRAEAVSRLGPTPTFEISSPEFPTFHATLTDRMPRHPPFLVISDIDDSVLKSDVLHKAKMLMNALHKPENRQPVPGTPELYRDLIAGTGNGPNLLLFVSGSPVYLDLGLEKFFEFHKFPEHALLLRDYNVRQFFQSKASQTQQLQDIQEFKLIQISKAMRWFHQTPVLLIGDSTQKDPEVYESLADAFPGRVRMVVIRDLTGQTIDNPRYTGLKSKVPFTVWTDPLALRRRLVAEGLIPPSPTPEVPEAPPMPPAPSPPTDQNGQTGQSGQTGQTDPSPTSIPAQQAY